MIINGDTLDTDGLGIYYGDEIGMAYDGLILSKHGVDRYGVSYPIELLLNLIILKLMEEKKVVPETIIGEYITLENWRQGFDNMIKGEVTKGVIVLDDTLE